MATRNIPTAPRAMLQKALSESTATSKELYPRLVLFEALAQFKDKHERRAPCSDDIIEARRDFLDSFAYLCDVERGGPTVTAAGLQKLPESNILWLAANEGIRNDIEAYAYRILSILQDREITAENMTSLIIQLAVAKCQSRLAAYRDEIQRHARNCRMQLIGEAQNDTVRNLRKNLEKLSEPPSTMTTLAELINICYKMRGLEVAEIKERSKKGLDDYDKLAHYIGRLGATQSSVHGVVNGMIKVPAIREISCIRTIDAPDARTMMLGEQNMSPYEILRRICLDSVSHNPLQNRNALQNFVELDSPVGAEVDRIRAVFDSRKTITTRVHAELQIADRFSRDRSMNFVGGDKYIGCSKPACYFCSSWLSNHKHGYVPSAAHYKIIPGCRGPDHDVNESGAAVLKEMYAKVCNRLGQDILGFLLTSGPGSSHATFQYQSTEGSSHA